MVNVKVEKQMNVSLDTIWGLFSNFGDLSWIAGEQKVEVIGEGVGMIRRLHMKGIDPFDEVLLAMDHEAHTYSYSIPKNSVIPFDNYVAEVTISGDANSGHVVWTSRFDAGDLDQDAARDMIAGNYQMMLDAAAEKLGG